MAKRMFDVTEHEERILGKFERRVEKKDVRIPRKVSRYILEEARQELLERARERHEWELIGQLYNPEPDSRAEALISSHMCTIYEETNGELPEVTEEEIKYL